jgi:multiple sugar transport system permease protein
MARPNDLRRRESIAGYLFITPALLYFFLFFLLPIVICIYAGFTNWNILSPRRMFVGLRNYEKIFSDVKFYSALGNTFYMLIPIPAYLMLALAFAFYCHKKLALEKMFRVVYYLPYISSVVALVLIWKWLFNSQYGLANHFLSLLGLGGPDWLGDPAWTKRMIVLMISWKMTGIISIYYIAALKNIPATYYEAAVIDGATERQQFFKITMPMLTPITFYLLVMGLIGSMQTFVEVQLFAPDGGRGYGVGTLIFYVWQKAFESSQMGYACAVVTLFGLFILALTALQFAVSNKWVYQGE